MNETKLEVCVTELQEIIKKLEYEKRFIKEILVNGLNLEWEVSIAETELEGVYESLDRDDLSTPELDAQECLSYWEQSL